MVFDWKAIVKTVAPALGTMLGGPLGGIAATAITSALGIEADSTEDQIAAAVRTATPEQLLALKNAENQFKLDMERIGVDYEKIAADDRDSARKREASVEGVGKYATPILAVLVIAGFFVAVGFVLFEGLGGLDAAAAAFVGTMVGYVSAKADQVVGYYFGSSAGSENKNRLLAAAGGG